MKRIGVFIGSTPLPLSEVATFGERATPWGDAAAQPASHAVGAHELVFLKRHGEDHEFAPHQINYRANIWLMHSLGLDGVIGTYTVGSVDPELDVGQLVVPTQIVDYTWGRAHTFDDELRHIDFTSPYDEDLRRGLLAGEAELVDGGVYGATQGPRLESAAEIVRMSRDGCTLVGMTGMPEAALARELDLPFAALCLVVNPAAGVSEAPLDLEEMKVVAEAGAERIVELLRRAVSRF